MMGQIDQRWATLQLYAEAGKRQITCKCSQSGSATPLESTFPKQGFGFYLDHFCSRREKQYIILNADTHPSSSALNPSQNWDHPLCFINRDTLAYSKPLAYMWLWKEMDEEAFQRALGKKNTLCITKKTYFFYIFSQSSPMHSRLFSPAHRLCFSFTSGSLPSHLVLQ